MGITASVGQRTLVANNTGPYHKRAMASIKGAAQLGIGMYNLHTALELSNFSTNFGFLLL